MRRMILVALCAILCSCSALERAANSAAAATESAKTAIDKATVVIDRAGVVVANAVTEGNDGKLHVDWTYLLGLLGVSGFAKITAKGEAKKVSQARDIARAQRGEKVTT